MLWGTKWVAMARHRLILWENGATSLGIILKYKYIYNSYICSNYLNKYPSQKVNNIDFSNILGMALPGVENVPTSLETIFKLSRGPQLPYTKKTHFVDFN